jgi:transposase-like protein
MSGPRLTQKQKNEIVARYQNGERTTRIAAAYGVNSSYPTILARRYGVQLRVPELSRKRRGTR